MIPRRFKKVKKAGTTPAVSGNEVAVAFADWIAKKTVSDPWFKYDWQGWYVHGEGHLTTGELFKMFEKAKATNR